MIKDRSDSSRQRYPVAVIVCDNINASVVWVTTRMGFLSTYDLTDENGILEFWCKVKRDFYYL